MNTTLQTGNLLIAEDEPLLSSALQRILTGEGHSVTLVSNGNKALELLTERHYDAVVSDIGMPEMDGISLLARLRELELDVPVILMTGAPSVASALKGIEYQAFHYLPKPFDFDELCSVVTRAISKTSHSSAHKRAELSKSFDKVLETFWMAFQPIVDRQGHVFGYEALLRSVVPELPHPGAVLEAAEKLGRLEELSRHIRLKTAALFIEHSPPDVVLFFNLHPLDLLDPELYENTPLSQIASRTVLEITERTSLTDIPNIESRIARLRELGYRIAVDDLGFGYAGLNSLITLNPDIVKLDMALVRNVHEHPNQQNIIRCVLTMRETIGFTVVAEGTETYEERDTLLELGCDFFQGYLIARPAPPFPTHNW